MKNRIKRLNIDIEFMTGVELKECLELVVKEYSENRLGGQRKVNGYSYKTMMTYVDEPEPEEEIRFVGRRELIGGVVCDVIPSKMNKEQSKRDWYIDKLKKKQMETKASNFPSKELTELSVKIAQGNREKGFWDSYEQAKAIHEQGENEFTESMVNSNINEKLLLVVTEVSEACESIRKGKMFQGFLPNGKDASDEEFPSLFETYVKDTFEDEIADSIIRLLDLAGGLGIDIGWHVEQKLRYNATRTNKHGKKF